MFRDIDADCYIMVDRDDTYPAEAAVEIEKLVYLKSRYGNWRQIIQHLF